MHHRGIFGNCNTNTSGLRDMYTQGLRVDISGMSAGLTNTM